MMTTNLTELATSIMKMITTPLEPKNTVKK